MSEVAVTNEVEGASTLDPAELPEEWFKNPDYDAIWRLRTAKLEALRRELDELA